MEFPHLKDTQFPLIDNVNVYKYKNNFDYARWKGKVSYKLLNVKWNSSYADVPYFDTDAKRDEWFDAQSGIVGVLESAFNNTPKDVIKVPIPYNDMYHCNYIVIDMPIQTSVDNPINYGNESLRISRWFFFIEDMEQFAPSTTELKISVDYWTTFIHTVSIPYLMLERGHAPMVQTNVNTYLSNPIVNNEYLLADDFNYGGETIIQTSHYKPIGNGKKFVLFCAPYSKQDFSLFNSSAWSGTSTGPTFANVDNRWGYQLDINDYDWKYGDADYSNAGMPISNMVQTGILNGCECFAIEGSQAKEFFNDCAKNCAHFIHGIKAMFILDESLFTKTDSFTFRNKTLYIADRKINTENFTFSKAEFGFDSKYADITKLYTSPYSMLEITDDEGSVFSAKIENCGNVQMHEEVALIYPFLNYNVFFSGINGAGTMNYTWKNVMDTNISKDMWASDFSKFMMNWKVPTYEIYVSAEDEYAANNSAAMATKRTGAMRAYQNAVRFANTMRENTADSFDTATKNVKRTTSANVANVAATESKNVSNVAASEATNVSNVADAMGTLVTNTANDNSANTDITDNNNDNNAYLTTKAQAKGYYDCAQDNNVTAAGIDATATNVMVGTVGNAINSMGSAGVAAGMAAAAGMPLTAGLAVASLGFIGGSVSSVTAAGKAATVGNAASQATTNKADFMCKPGGYLDDVNENIRDTNTANTTVRNTANMNNATNTRTMQNGNATRTESTNNANAVRTQTTNNANAERSKTAADTNAENTQDTETDNATYTRGATVVAEQAKLRQAQTEAANSYKNVRLHAPHEQGAYSGDFMPDAYQRRGVRVNIRTQSKSAIAQAGDAMLRFGYALHRVWDMSGGFHYCKDFTFWKAEDIWINDGTGVANISTNAIANILLSGVTVWRDASKIGTVGIYDNYEGGVTNV